MKLLKEAEEIPILKKVKLTKLLRAVPQRKKIKKGDKYLCKNISIINKFDREVIIIFCLKNIIFC